MIEAVTAILAAATLVMSRLDRRDDKAERGIIEGLYELHDLLRRWLTDLEQTNERVGQWIAAGRPPEDRYHVITAVVKQSGMLASYDRAHRALVATFRVLSVHLPQVEEDLDRLRQSRSATLDETALTLHALVISDNPDLLVSFRTTLAEQQVALAEAIEALRVFIAEYDKR